MHLGIDLGKPEITLLFLSYGQKIVTAIADIKSEKCA